MKWGQRERQYREVGTKTLQNEAAVKAQLSDMERDPGRGGKHRRQEAERAARAVRNRLGEPWRCGQWGGPGGPKAPWVAGYSGKSCPRPGELFSYVSLLETGESEARVEAALKHPQGGRPTSAHNPRQTFEADPKLGH